MDFILTDMCIVKSASMKSKEMRLNLLMILHNHLRKYCIHVNLKGIDTQLQLSFAIPITVLL